MTDLSREALKRLDATLRTSLREASQILRERGVDNGALWAATQALVPILNLMRDLTSSGGGGVAGANPPPAGEVSPPPVSYKGFEPIYDPLGLRPTNADGSPYRFSDPLAEEEASKASAPEGPADAVVIQLAELRQRAAKLARHDNERKPQP